MTSSRDLSLATKGVLVVTIPVTALLVAMAVFYQFERQSERAERAVEQTFEVRGEIRRVLMQMINAETGIRGYLLTRRPSFLEPYESALRELPQVRANLRRLAQDDPAQSARAERVQSLASEVLAAMERSRRKVAGGSEGAAMAELEADKAAMDALRAELGAMADQAQHLVAARTAEARQAQRRTSAAIFWGGGFGLLGGLLAALLFTTRIASRVRLLEGEAREVAAGRPIAHEVKGRDEIARLERTLQETSELLRKRADELRKAHGELESRVEQRTTELSAANEALRVSNEVRQALFQATPLAIWAVDLNGDVTFWNPAAERIFGWLEAEVLGRPLPLVRAEDLEEYRDWLRRFENGEAFSLVERRRRRKDGSEIDVTIWTAPLRDSEGRIRGTIAIDSDVSEQKLLEAEFRQSQKLEAVGRLAGGVAHDFNNLLTVIQGYADMVAMEAENSPVLQDYAREIEEATGRATALTAQLLTFSRRQTSRPKVLDLNGAVARSTKLLRRVIGEDIEIVTHLDPELGRIRADPIHIDQVIMNLAVNARDAMSAGGRLTIETRNQRLDAEYAGRHIGVEPGPYCMLAISDTGTGMTAETRSRIFEPFFTTKEAGKGTGLGLSIVYGIVKQNQGEIIVYSELGRGTTFKIYLPIVEAPAEASPERQRAAATRGNETILLCEDDAEIRELVGKILRKQGYGVLAAAGAEEAIRIARENREPIHVLLTDVVMPRTNGFELASALRRVRPETKVIYMSGYTDSHVTGGLSPDDHAPFLQKPFTAEAVSQIVRQVLDEAEGAAGTSR